MILILLWSCVVRSTLDVILRYSAAAAVTAAARWNHDDDDDDGVGWWPASGVPACQRGGARSREASTPGERPFRARARLAGLSIRGGFQAAYEEIAIRRVDNNIIFFAASHATDFASGPYGHAFFSLLFPLVCFFPVLFSFPRCASFPHYTDSRACVCVSLFLRIFFPSRRVFFNPFYIYMRYTCSIHIFIILYIYICVCRAHVLSILYTE